MKRGFLLNSNNQDEKMLQFRGRGSSSGNNPFHNQDRVGLRFSKDPSPWSARSAPEGWQQQQLRNPYNRVSQIVTKNTKMDKTIQKPWAELCDVEDIHMEQEEFKMCSDFPQSDENASNPESSVRSPAYVIPARRQNPSPSHDTVSKSSPFLPESISLLHPPAQSLPPPPPVRLSSSSTPFTVPSTSQSTATITTTTDPSYNTKTGNAFLPTKTKDVPKAALSGWYGQRPRTHQLSKSQFISWDDSGPPHRRRFTSLFVCPLTGEIFASGRFGGGDEPNQQQPPPYLITKDPQTGCDIVWYSKYFH
jgi:hypothetical protein